MKSDERILGDGEFAQAVLDRAQEHLEKRYRLKAHGYDLEKVTLRVSSELGIDPEQALLNGGVAIGTAGLSILAKGLWDRLANTAPLCEEILRTGPASMNKPKRRTR